MSKLCGLVIIRHPQHLGPQCIVPPTNILARPHQYIDTPCHIEALLVYQCKSPCYQVHVGYTVALIVIICMYNAIRFLAVN